MEQLVILISEFLGFSLADDQASGGNLYLTLPFMRLCCRFVFMDGELAFYLFCNKYYYITKV